MLTALAVLLLAVGATPVPNVRGPVPVTADSYPFMAAHKSTPALDLSKIGYVEEEFVVSGTSNVYDWAADGSVNVKTPSAPYTTRILVRRPVSNFSGTVIVELLYPARKFDWSMMYVMILVPIYFCIYWQLREQKTAPSPIESKIRVEYLLAWLGTATLTALARFELPLETVVVGYAAIVLVALLVAWLMHLRVFLYQALVVLGLAAYRISTHNFFRLHESFSSSLSSSIWAILLLAAGTKNIGCSG
jgi:hypothetical protein